ncbi:MAG: 3-oxoacyl-ACP reductase FabG [Chloroflexi bacterium]|nr:3-oxoacyl-ACP reductase FabG [Chloroflexota bacterium]
MQGRVAFVTGAARGLGKATALALAAAGADVAVADVNEAVETTAEEIRAAGRRSVAAVFDVAQPGSVRIGVSAAEKALGPIEILVNNAAITTNVALVHEMRRDAWDRELAINLGGVFNCIQAVLPQMLERRYGRIVNISSVAGTLGGQGQASYAASKAGIIGLTRTVALEGARAGITCNAVVPGVIATDAYYAIPERLRDRIVKRVAMGRPGEPADVANAVVFLASDQARYVTGATLVVGGGIDLLTF